MDTQTNVQTIIQNRESIINLIKDYDTIELPIIEELKNTINLLKTYIPSEKFDIPPSNFSSIRDKSNLNDKQIAKKIGITCPNQIPKIMDGTQKKVKKNIAKNIIDLMQEYQIQPQYNSITPPTSPNKSKKKKNTSSPNSTEKITQNEIIFLETYDKVNWKTTYENQTIHKLSAKEIKSFIHKHNLKIDGKFPIKSVAKGIVTKFLRELYQEQQENNTNPTDNLDEQEQEQEQEQEKEQEKEQEQEKEEEKEQEKEEEKEEEQPNLTLTPIEDENNGDTTDDESDSDNEDIQEITIQGIKYYIDDGYVLDQKTAERLGPINDDPDDWDDQSRKIHMQNIINKMSSM